MKRPRPSVVADPAPALTRGLRVLGLLAVDGQSSLEQLARKTGWPKSSVLRYLVALASSGVVAQNPTTKAWTARKILAPAPADLLAECADARQQLPGLAAITGHCAELYRFAEGKLVLIDRAEPEGTPVSVNARIGFVRDLGELDATAAVTFAFSADIAPPRRLFRWNGGERVTVSATGRDRVLADVRRTRQARDHDFNVHGIRRFAAPVFAANRFVGLLAVAQRQTPRAESEIPKITGALAATLANFT